MSDTTKTFIRVTVRVPIDFFVGPIGVPVPDGVDPATWEEDDILEAAREVFEVAAAAAMPGAGFFAFDAYPTGHALAGQWGPVSAEKGMDDPEIESCEQFERKQQ